MFALVQVLGLYTGFTINLKELRQERNGLTVVGCETSLLRKHITVRVLIYSRMFFMLKSFE